MRTRRTIQGKDHDLVLFRVDEKDEHGRPKRVTVLYDEQTVQIEQGMEFVTAFVPSDCVKKVVS
jgi:hypothetical protein